MRASERQCTRHNVDLFSFVLLRPQRFRASNWLGTRLAASAFDSAL